MKESGKNYKRIVIKIGSSLFCSSAQKIDFDIFNAIAGQVAELAKSGKDVIVVSSGAIALGMHLLGLKSRPRELAFLQAAAAVGQNELMDIYRDFFKARGYHGAQVLLTREDFNDRSRYLNAKNTLNALLNLGSIPVINENDTVSTDEIKFGDNDRLSALVATLVSADILIILSDVDGLLDKDRKTVIRLVDEITPEIKRLACPTDKKACVGGMITKLEAAKIAVDSGIPCVIANGLKKDIIISAIQAPEESGTLFLSKRGLDARKRWIAFGTKTKGKIVIDDGARNALKNKKSLLSVGITSIEGNFNAGDIVSVYDADGNEFARGKADISAKQLKEIKGMRYHKEIMHCDNIVIL